MRGSRCDSAFASSFARSLVDLLSSGVSQLTVLDQIAVHALAVADESLEARGCVCWYTRGTRRITDCRGDASTVSQFGGTATRSLFGADPQAARCNYSRTF